MSLGSFEVTPLEIAFAYSVFANLGVKAEPVSILAVVTRDGNLLETRNVKMKRVAPASVCYVMNDVLKDVFTYGTAGRRALARLRARLRRQDRHDQQLPRRLVHRLLAAHPLAGLDRLRRRPQRPPGRRRRLPADLDAPHEPHRRPHRRRRLETPRRRHRARDRPASPGMLATPYCPTTRSEIYVAGTEPSRSARSTPAAASRAPICPEPDDLRRRRAGPARTGGRSSAAPRSSARRRRKKRTACGAAEDFRRKLTSQRQSHPAGGLGGVT